MLQAISLTGPAVADELAGPFDMGGQFTIDQAGLCECDLVRDGIINFRDFALVASHWWDHDCIADNNWCDGTDINQSQSVDFNDLRVMTVLCWLDEDINSPTPDPMQWDPNPDGNGLDGTPHEVPRPCGVSTCYWAVMRAHPDTADETGFEFHFECHENGGVDSGWLSFPDGPPYKYEVNLGISPQRYGWRVKARDTSIRQTETAPSGWTYEPWP